MKVLALLGVFTLMAYGKVRISEEKFVHEVLRMCKHEYACVPVRMTREEHMFIKKTLEVLYERCRSRGYELAAVTATVMHNTSWLRILEANNWERYKSRGIFQITTEGNYKILTRVGRHGYDYVREPRILAKRWIEVVKDSVYFWLEISKDYKEIDLMRIICITNPTEYQILTNRQDYTKHEVAEACKRYENREHIYKRLCKLIYGHRE